MKENLDQNSKVFAEILKNSLFGSYKRQKFQNWISFDFEFFRILRIVNFNCLKPVSLSIHGSVLLILQKHCKTPLKTQTVHSNSYTTF